MTAAAMAGGAGVTYGVMSHKSALPQAENQPSPPATAPTYSDAERDAAKQHLCGAFDASTRGHKDRGAVVVDGEPNVLVILRKVGSVKAVENALAPATPPEVAVAAHKYIDTALDVTTAAMEGASGEDLTRLVVVGNEAIRAFVGVCGLRH